MSESEEEELETVGRPVIDAPSMVLTATRAGVAKTVTDYTYGEDKQGVWLLEMATQGLATQLQWEQSATKDAQDTTERMQ